MTARYEIFVASIARTDQNTLIITLFVLAGLFAWWLLGGLSLWPRIEKISKSVYMTLTLVAFVASMLIS